MHGLSDKGAAVEEERRLIVLLVWFPVSLSVWDAKVLLAGVNKPLSELLLESWVLSVRVSVLGHVVAVLDFILLCLEEAAEVILQGAFLRATKD